MILDPGSLSPRITPNLTLALIVLGLWRFGARSALAPQVGAARRLARIAIIALGALATLHVATVAWVDRRLAASDHANAPSDPRKVWGARGLVLDGPTIERHGSHNTIESVTRAFDRGAQGCEVDVFFDPELGTFVVSHDRPYHRHQGKLLLLEELLAAVRQRGAIWLDWKKLRHLSRAELGAAIRELDRLMEGDDLRSRFYVEGEDPLHLGRLRSAGFLTIFDTQPLRDSSPVTTLLVDLYKLVYHFGGHTVMGMNTGTEAQPIYGSETQRSLRNVPIFIYHAPSDPADLKSLAARKDVRVILVQDHSTDRYSVTADG